MLASQHRLQNNHRRGEQEDDAKGNGHYCLVNTVETPISIQGEYKDDSRGSFLRYTRVAKTKFYKYFIYIFLIFIFYDKNDDVKHKGSDWKELLLFGQV